MSLAPEASKNDMCAILARLANQLPGKVDKIVGVEVSSRVGADICLRRPTVLQRAADKRGTQAAAPCGSKIVLVRGDQHHRSRRQSKQRHGAEIDFGIRFVVTKELGR